MSIGGFFKTIAPWTAAAVQFVPGFGPVAAQAISTIAQASGHPTIKADGTISSISDAVAVMSGNADAMLKLKEFEAQTQQQMQQLGFQHVEELEKIAEQDRESARNREIQIRDLTPRVMGGGVLAGFIVAVFMVLTGHAKADSVMAGTLIGYLSAKAELVLTYYFGSSAGSDRKTELLAQRGGGAGA